jgi:serine protease AprX
MDTDERFTGRGVTIAFIDSGFFPHPDLTKPVHRIRAFVDATAERHPVSYFRLPHPESWHGTMSAVIAAGNGHLSHGVHAGLAPDARLVLVKVMNVTTGRVSADDIAEGLEWILLHRRTHDIRVINLAVGGDDPEPLARSRVDMLVERAVREGVVVVAAAGNSPGQPVLPPASAPSAITVGGVRDNNSFNAGHWSPYPTSHGLTLNGDMKPDIAAPASAIAGPLLPGTGQFRECALLFRILKASPSLGRRILQEHREELGVGHLLPASDALRNWVLRRLNEGRYVAPTAKSMEGTSVAASIVSSVVAQMIEANPLLTPQEVKKILMKTARPLPVRDTDTSPVSVMNARLAVQHALLQRHAADGARVQTTNGYLSFVIHRSGTDRVELAAEFNEWDAAKAPFHEVVSGRWSCLIPAPAPGRYPYKLVIDGKNWCEDPECTDRAPDGFGGWNSVLTVD